MLANLEQSAQIKIPGNEPIVIPQIVWANSTSFIKQRICFLNVNDQFELLSTSVNTFAVFILRCLEKFIKFQAKRRSFTGVP
jgi:hypothetical protein